MLGSISTISVSEKTRDDVYRQLTDLIGHQVKITSYYYKDIETGGSFRDDLVLITSPWIKKVVLPLLAPDCAYLCAKRNLDLKNIHRLLDIPRGAEVLVINDLYENAVEVVNELEAFGIDQYKFFPYDPGKPLTKEFTYGITIGEFDPILRTLPHVVDLGMRQINLLTVAEILKFFTNEIMVDELITSRYTKTSVQSICNLHSQVRENEDLRAKLSDVLEKMEDGVLILGGNLVEFHNQAAEELLQVPLNKELPHAFAASLAGKEDEKFFLQYGEKSLNVEIRTIAGGRARMVILKDMALLRRMDIDYRTYQKDEGNKADYTFAHILYQDETMKDVIISAKQMADSHSNILITGESGVGKEIMAQAIHNASPFRDGPFVAINCGAISEQLLESELFGYDEGAFTGALKKGKIGLIELANNGSLFLDEIGDAPLSIQQKLLRVIQEKKVMRVSGRQPINVNLRIIAATNQDLVALIEEKKFRQDLYYRLNVLTVRIPPLCQRKKDIAILFQYFLRKHLTGKGYTLPVLPAGLLDSLEQYDWPGNIRELQNLSEYLANYLVHTRQPDLEREVAGFLACRKRAADKRLRGNSRGFCRQAISERREEKSAGELSLEEEFVFSLLAELFDAGVLAGKQQIMECCRRRSEPITDYRLRKIMKGLSDKGYVNSARGRGITFTSLGVEAAKELKEQEQ